MESYKQTEITQLAFNKKIMQNEWKRIFKMKFTFQEKEINKQ